LKSYFSGSPKRVLYLLYAGAGPEVNSDGADRNFHCLASCGGILVEVRLTMLVVFQYF